MGFPHPGGKARKVGLDRRIDCFDIGDPPKSDCHPEKRLTLSKPEHLSQGPSSVIKNGNLNSIAVMLKFFQHLASSITIDPETTHETSSGHGSG
jgi:hypothetical protein